MTRSHTITRRTLAAGLFAASTTFPAAKASSAQESSPVAPPAGATRVVTDILGHQVTVPSDPQRVICLDVNLLGLAIALGVTPVASSKFATADAFPRILGRGTENVTVLGKNETLDVEIVVGLKPDLILMTYYGDPTTYDLVKNIAPTVLSGEFRNEWRSDSAIIGDALNRNTEHEAISALYDQRTAAIASDLPDHFKNTDTAVLRFTAEGIRQQKRNACCANILHDLTLEVPDVDPESNGIATDLSIENIRELDFPSLWICSDGNADADKSVTDFLQSDLVKELQSVKNETIYFVPQEYWTTLRGYLSAEYIMNDIEKYLIYGESSSAFPA